MDVNLSIMDGIDGNRRALKPFVLAGGCLAVCFWWGTSRGVKHRYVLPRCWWLFYAGTFRPARTFMGDVGSGFWG